MTDSAAWAPFLSESELRVFLTMVEAELHKLGLSYRMLEGVVEVDLDEGTQSLGLSNLAQVCGRMRPVDWPEAIAKHFELVVGSSEEEVELRGVVHDFEAVRSILRVRLYESWLEDQVTRPVGPGLVAGVVFDLKSAMRSLTRAEAAIWNRTDEEIFEAALANLAKEETAEPQTIRGPEDVPIVVVEGTSCYAASKALLLERDAVPDGHPYGALVIVPNRHVYFYHLIEDNRVLVAVNALVSLAMEAYKRGPGSISDRVYWVRHGEFVAIEWNVDDGTLYVSPPARFLKEVLERVSQEPS